MSIGNTTILVPISRDYDLSRIDNEIGAIVGGEVDRNKYFMSFSFPRELSEEVMAFAYDFFDSIGEPYVLWEEILLDEDQVVQLSQVLIRALSTGKAKHHSTHEFQELLNYAATNGRCMIILS